MTDKTTNYDEHILSHKLIVLVKLKELYDMFENERDSSVESSKLGREPTWLGSKNVIRSYGTREIHNAPGLTEGNPTSLGAAEAQLKR